MKTKYKRSARRSIFINRFPIEKLTNNPIGAKKLYRFIIELFGRHYILRNYPPVKKCQPILLVNQLITYPVLFSILRQNGYTIQYMVDGESSPLDKLKIIDYRPEKKYCVTDMKVVDNIVHEEEYSFLTIKEIILQALMYRKDDKMFEEGFYFFAGGSICHDGTTVKIFFCDKTITLYECDFLQGSFISGNDVILKGKIKK